MMNEIIGRICMDLGRLGRAGGGGEVKLFSPRNFFDNPTRDVDEKKNRK